MINQCPIFVLNLERSPDRWESMRRAFVDTLTRFIGIDGRQWDTGDKITSGVAAGKPVLSPNMLFRLAGMGIVHREAPQYSPYLSPYEVGFTLSQMAVWREIEDKKIPMAIVLEDDCEPVISGHSLFDIDMPADAEVLFLTGPDTLGPEHKIYCDINNEVVNGSGNAGGNLGYVITLEGAKKAIAATLPMIFPCDYQWHHSFEKWAVQLHAPVPQCEKTKAYGSRPAVIRASTQSHNSDCTSDGKKPWLKYQLFVGDTGVL